MVQKEQSEERKRKKRRGERNVLHEKFLSFFSNNTNISKQYIFLSSYLKRACHGVQYSMNKLYSQFLKYIFRFEIVFVKYF